MRGVSVCEYKSIEFMLMCDAEPTPIVEPRKKELFRVMSPLSKENLTMSTYYKQCFTVLGLSAVLFVSACSSMKAPAKTEVAVSAAAVDTAAAAGATEFAPVEMNLAREKMTLARKALATKDYEKAIDLANQAEADAKLAQTKAASAKAQAAAQAVQDDVQVLREELIRANTNK